MSYAGTMEHRRRPGAGLPSRRLMAAIGIGALSLAFAPVAWMLWPQGAAIAPDAPSVPITVGGTTFSVPPAAIRFRMQRRPGVQPRIDMTFLWPSLSPPDGNKIGRASCRERVYGLV